MKRGKKLRKQLRKAEAVNPELTEVESSVERPVKPLLFALAGLVIVLVVAFLVWPFLRNQSTTKPPSGSQALTYELKNPSSQTWSKVTLTIQGDLTVASTNPKMNKGASADEDGVSNWFFLGDLKPGESKTLVIYVVSSHPGHSDTVETRASFKVADGTTVHLPIQKTVTFQ